MAEKIAGTVRKIAYRKDNGFCVLEVAPDNNSFTPEDQNGNIKVVGVLPDVAVGEALRFTGSWQDDSRYGKQFRASAAVHRLPNTESEIIDYLSSDAVKGIGPETSRRIVEEYGEATLEQLIEDPGQVFKAPFLRPGQVEIVLKRWREDHLERTTVAWLQEAALFSYELARRVFDKYGDKSVSLIKHDTYQLAVDGLLSFNEAGDLVKQLGVETIERQKRQAALLFSLQDFERQGHTFAPRKALLTDVSQRLQLTGEYEESDLLAALEQLQEEQKLGEEELLLDDSAKATRAIYLPELWHAEESVSKMLREHAGRSDLFGDEQDHTDSALQASDDLPLNYAQLAGVSRAVNWRLSVLTGGPGTGKTLIMKSLTNYLRNKNYRVRLAAPTGRAANQLAKAADHGASTIHRLLGWDSDNKSVKHHRGNPLPLDLLVVDEASMLGLRLFHKLLEALPPKAHLLLVGDTDQLPPVEAGNVLHDLIKSELAPVTRLQDIYRQDESSSIIENANRIRQGKHPNYDTSESGNFFIFHIENADQAAEQIVELASHKIAEKWDLDPLRDIQIIAPQKQRKLGVNNLNMRLRRVLIDSSAPKVALGTKSFQVGEKIMQTKNDYSRGVFNGDIGFVVGINHAERTLAVAFERHTQLEDSNGSLPGFLELPDGGGEVIYSFDDAQSLEYAYCITVHKAQGSEYPAVIVPVHGEQSPMLMTRKLLYTAITRAQQVVCLVGTRDAVQNAIDRAETNTRYSGLLARL